MIPLQSRPKVSPLSSNLRAKRRKRFSGGMLVGIGVTLVVALLAVGIFAAQKSGLSHAASNDSSQGGGITTINGLQTIAQIGSTADILDANGNPIAANPDPYKIAIAPADLSPTLRAGDVLVSNIGNDTHGVTIVKFAQQPGTGRVFNTMPGDGVLGPSGLVFDNGKVLVGNSTGNNVLVLNSNGTLFATITNPLFNGPWGITVGRAKSSSDSSHKGLASFFTANKFDGKILRVDVTTSSDGGAMQFNVVQIGQYALNGKVSKIDLHWLPKLKVGSETLKDVLLTIDPAGNRVAAFAKSSTLQAVGTPVTVFQGTPLNNPGGLTINPLNGDILVVNLNDNNLVELNAKMGTVVGVKAIDPTIVDAQGNNSALFGVVATKDDQGNLKVFFTNDNTNTLNVLSK